MEPKPCNFHFSPTLALWLEECKTAEMVCLFVWGGGVVYVGLLLVVPACQLDAHSFHVTVESHLHYLVHAQSASGAQCCAIFISLPHDTVQPMVV